MAKTKKQKNITSSARLWLAPVLVAAGVIGLIVAVTLSNKPTSTNSAATNALQVKDSTNGSTNQSQTGAGSSLQGAARTKDLIQGREADSLQQGSASDALTKDVNLQ
jgi:hypothetical protein